MAGFQDDFMHKIPPGGHRKYTKNPLLEGDVNTDKNGTNQIFYNSEKVKPYERSESVSFIVVVIVLFCFLRQSLIPVLTILELAM